MDENLAVNLGQGQACVPPEPLASPVVSPVLSVKDLASSVALRARTDFFPYHRREIPMSALPRLMSDRWIPRASLIPPDPEKCSRGSHANMGLWLRGGGDRDCGFNYMSRKESHDLPVVAMKEGGEMKELFSVAATWSSTNMKEGSSSESWLRTGRMNGRRL